MLKFSAFFEYDITKFILVFGLFKRGASEAAEGCLASVAAKLVKTALENLFSILARGNKSTAANFGFFFLLFVRHLLWPNLPFSHIT